LDFLWNQLEIGYREIRKPAYKQLVGRFLFDNELRKKVEKLRDTSGRNYEGGCLEKTASVLSLALCIYDNYPELDIDLLLSAIILNCLCRAYPKKKCYEIIKEEEKLIPFLFRKKRKKPSVELTAYDGIIKLDNKIYLSLRKWRGKIKIK